MISKISIPLTGMILGVICFIPPAFASVRVFPTNQTPYQLQTAPQKSVDQSPDKIFSDSSASTFAPIKPNRTTLTQQVLEAIRNNQASFGLTEVTSETLRLQKKPQKDSFGTSLRFAQYHNEVRIEGAELVALADQNHQLTTLNSSLVPTPTLNTQPDLTREEAKAIAFESLGYSDPELGYDPNDGLLIALLEKKPVLVWQFSVRDRQDPTQAAQIQISAQHPRAGQIVKTLNMAAGLAPIDVYDSSITIIVPNPIFKGIKVIENGTPLYPSSHVSNEATASLGAFEKTLEFYADNFNRNSYDGQGAQIDSIVNVQRIGFVDLLNRKQNAGWLAPWKMFMFGAGGDKLAGLAGALDVVGHEFTHAVVSSTSDLVYTHESGALNEHLADLFGAMIQRKYENPEKPFLIGESVLRGELKKKAEALRDMLEPERGVTKQPSNTSEIPAELQASCVPTAQNDNCGVHILSGIPNKASALIIQALGWEETYQLFYRVMTVRLLSRSSFFDYRNQVIDECWATMPKAACETVEQAFREVGIR